MFEVPFNCAGFLDRSLEGIADNRNWFRGIDEIMSDSIRNSEDDCLAMATRQEIQRKRNIFSDFSGKLPMNRIAEPPVTEDVFGEKVKIILPVFPGYLRWLEARRRIQ